jgi:hypothetical protein
VQIIWFNGEKITFKRFFQLIIQRTGKFLAQVVTFAKNKN